MLSPHATDDKVAEVRALKQTGHTYGEITAQTGISDRQITRWTVGEMSTEIMEATTQFVTEMRSSSIAKAARAIDRRWDEHLDGVKELSDQQLFVGYGILSDKDHQSRNTAVTINAIMPTIILGDATKTIEGELA